MCCVDNAGKNAIYKKDINEFINVSHIVTNYIIRYVATFCDLKKKAKSYFIF